MVGEGRRRVDVEDKYPNEEQDCEADQERFPKLSIDMHLVADELLK